MNVISWDPFPTAASYLVQSAPTATGSWTTVATVLSGTTTCTDDADPLTWYQVIAVDALGQQSVPGPAFLPNEALLYDAYGALLGRVKDYLAIDETIWDDTLSFFLTSAGAFFDSYTGRDLIGELGSAPYDLQLAAVEFVAVKWKDRLSRKAPGADGVPTWLPGYMPRSITDVLDRYVRIPV